jgi:hypothetical protein
MFTVGLQRGALSTICWGVITRVLHSFSLKMSSFVTEIIVIRVVSKLLYHHSL